MQFASLDYGLGSAIVEIIREYGAVTVDFLVDHVHHEQGEVEHYLGILERKGTVLRNGGKISLVPDER